MIAEETECSKAPLKSSPILNTWHIDRTQKFQIKLYILVIHTRKEQQLGEHTRSRQARPPWSYHLHDLHNIFAAAETKWLERNRIFCLPFESTTCYIAKNGYCLRQKETGLVESIAQFPKASFFKTYTPVWKRCVYSCPQPALKLEMLYTLQSAGFMAPSLWLNTFQIQYTVERKLSCRKLLDKHGDYKHQWLRAPHFTVQWWLAHSNAIKQLLCTNSVPIQTVIANLTETVFPLPVAVLDILAMRSKLLTISQQFNSCADWKAKCISAVQRQLCHINAHKLCPHQAHKAHKAENQNHLKSNVWEKIWGN